MAKVHPKVMKSLLLLFLMLVMGYSGTFAQTEAPEKSLNAYIDFLSRSAEVTHSRFMMLQAYQNDVNLYLKKPVSQFRLSSSGPLEEYYYKKALEGDGISGAEKQRLNASADKIWLLLNGLDEIGKTLETYVRLKSYADDNFQKTDVLVSQMKAQLRLFSDERVLFYQQIQRVYRRYQPYTPTDPYQSTGREMEQILISQQQLLDSLPYYLNEENRSEWPIALVQRSLLAGEKMSSGIGKSEAKIAYPASAVIKDFKSALNSLQALKSNAIDAHTFAAGQSARHGNAVYLSLINAYNHDLLASYKSFVNYSQSAKRLLDYPAFSPVFANELTETIATDRKSATPFQDISPIAFAVKPAAAPASAALQKHLNQYVEFMNESLRQMHLMQVLMRNYQSSAEYHRDPARSKSRAALTYSHEDFKIPVSAYQLLISKKSLMPEPYRASVSGQLEVLMNVLKEMDALSVELIGYTQDKQYLQDQLRRSDAILDRYASLFDTFDKKKEQLYVDVRRIFESYPVANPSGSWCVSGRALLHTVDNNREILFGVRAFLAGKAERVPATAKLESDAKQLIADEYKNLKGLQRYGRSNGLCPYSPYEDLAANSLRFAEKALNLKLPVASSGSHPYESFYYFYNNELIYQYNKFVELAKTDLLQAVNQPDVFLFRRIFPTKTTVLQASQVPQKSEEAVVVESKPTPKTSTKENLAAQTGKTTEGAAPGKLVSRDTVYIERTRVDTVYVDREDNRKEVSRSLEGFATNNMVLLLDVSASMNSPFKLPLLKRSIKSLLTLLRPEDQISIVLYSGKARVVLKPTSGSKSAEIARMIDLLQSSGDTDGNEGIKLAYKVANKQYIRGGNNRIVLATDGEFPVSDEVFKMIGDNASQDVYLTVFTFGRSQINARKLKKMSQLGRGTYAHVTEERADLQLIIEAQAKKLSDK
jgi:Mg-chelatase subunit ChlD